jgi:TatD DNase family protein
MFIDTHAHLYSKEFDSEIENVLQRAFLAKVEKFFLPNIDPQSVEENVVVGKKISKHLFSNDGVASLFGQIGLGTRISRHQKSFVF